MICNSKNGLKSFFILGYPDLARHPLSYSSVPPTFSTLPVPNPYSSSSPKPYSSTPEPYNPQPFNTSTNNSVQIERTQSLDSEYHPSRYITNIGKFSFFQKYLFKRCCLNKHLTLKY